MLLTLYILLCNNALPKRHTGQHDLTFTWRAQSRRRKIDNSSGKVCTDQKGVLAQNSWLAENSTHQPVQSSHQRNSPQTNKAADPSSTYCFNLNRGLADEVSRCTAVFSRSRDV